MKQTALYERHVAAGAKIVDFGGWAMPLHYGSQIDEHHCVRKSAGMFDVSHMTVIDVSGKDADVWMRYLLANDVTRLQQPGKGLYSCMLNEQGGVVDDLIVYRCGENAFRVVVNAATRESDLQWMNGQTTGFEVNVSERADLSMIAVQGPEARTVCAPLLNAASTDASEAVLALASFESYGGDNELFVARTGYTGEDGWEIILSAEAAGQLWDSLVEAGVQPCGLGARDTLRLEAGLNLYGQDMTTEVSPLQSNLGWTVAWEPAERDFVGRSALEKQKRAGIDQRLVGLLLEGRGIMRSGQPVYTESGQGVVTSGGFSPTMECSIAMARVPADCGEQVEVQIRKNTVPAKVVRPPFVRNGQIQRR
jgi:aminomethyltransferase